MKTEPDLSKYEGQWVITCKNQVIAHDKNLSKLHNDIKKCKTTPTLTKVPKEEILIF